jgi:hypothetical protein
LGTGAHLTLQVERTRDVHIADDNGDLNEDNRLLFRVEGKYHIFARGVN